MGAKGPTSGDPFSADFELSYNKLENAGDYVMSLWILMYCKTGCANNEYFIRANIKDDFGNNILDDYFFYDKDGYSPPKWINKRIGFNFRTGQIKVRITNIEKKTIHL